MGSMNFHWALLQGVAWGGMLSSYQSETGSLRVAIEMTFGGAYPCEICGVVDENLPAADDGEWAEFWKQAKDSPLVLIGSAAMRFRSEPIGTAAEWAARAARLGSRPESPPPRMGIA